MTDEKLIEALLEARRRQQERNEMEPAPDPPAGYPKPDPERCVPMPLLIAPLSARKQWTPADREHVEDCDWCQRMIGLSYRNGCPSDAARRVYAMDPKAFPNRKAMRFHLDHDECGECATFLESPAVQSLVAMAGVRDWVREKVERWLEQNPPALVVPVELESGQAWMAGSESAAGMGEIEATPAEGLRMRLRRREYLEVELDAERELEGQTIQIQLSGAWKQQTLRLTIRQGKAIGDLGSVESLAKSLGSELLVEARVETEAVRQAWWKERVRQAWSEFDRRSENLAGNLRQEIQRLATRAEEMAAAALEMTLDAAGLNSAEVAPGWTNRAYKAGLQRLPAAMLPQVRLTKNGTAETSRGGGVLISSLRVQRIVVTGVNDEIGVDVALRHQKPVSVAALIPEDEAEGMRVEPITMTGEKGNVTFRKVRPGRYLLLIEGDGSE